MNSEELLRRSGMQSLFEMVKMQILRLDGQMLTRRQSEDKPANIAMNWILEEILQCFDAVGWAAGRASGL